MRKLPVFATLGEVLSGVTRHYFQLLAASWPAVLVLLTAFSVYLWQLNSVGYFAALTANEGKPDLVALEAAGLALASGSNALIFYSAEIVLIVASAVAAVRWHRLVLLGEGTNGEGGVVVLRKEDGTYLLTLLKIILLVVLVVLVIGALIALTAMLKSVPLYGLILIVMVVSLFILYFWLIGALLRLSLALPDASIGAGGRVFAVYKASAGNTMRLVGLTFLLGFVTLIGFAVIMVGWGAVTGVALGAGASASLAVMGAGAVIGLAAYLYFLMAQVTMLSVAYREIIGLPGRELSPEA